MSFTIDVHHHILPDFFWRETNDGAHPVGGIAPPPWDEASALAFMDDAGIDVAVTSISTPGVHVGDDTRARSLARRCNELAATMMQKRPDRFGGFAALPLPDVDGALEELAYALDVLKLDGVVLFSNSNGVYLGDKRFEAVFEELERRSAVVFVHPTASPDLAAHQLGLPDSLIDFTADTTRVVAQMLYSNRFARTPSVKYIFSHAGGTVPYLAGRFAIVDEMNVIPGGEIRGDRGSNIPTTSLRHRALLQPAGAQYVEGCGRPYTSAVRHRQSLFASRHGSQICGTHAADNRAFRSGAASGPSRKCPAAVPTSPKRVCGLSSR